MNIQTMICGIASKMKSKLGYKGSVIGIDMGATSVKLAQVVNVAGKLILMKTAAAEILIKSNDRRSAKLEALRKVFNGIDTKKAKLICVVNCPKTCTRIIAVPPMPKQELFEAVRWEAKNYVSFPVEEANLDFNVLKRELWKYKLIVTFNGSAFDIPFIQKRYPNLLPNVPNFDLRVACSRVGLTGGLKEIERKLGIRRNKIIEKMYGGDALSLWKMYRATGDDYYLKLLVEYNEEDVFNLKKIADYVYERLRSRINN